MIAPGTEFQGTQKRLLRLRAEKKEQRKCSSAPSSAVDEPLRSQNLSPQRQRVKGPAEVSVGDVDPGCSIAVDEPGPRT